MEDLDRWQVYLEKPVTVNYKGIDVYKLTTWVQGPVMLQALNMLENFDLQAMGYNSTRYIHTLYQVMNLAFADRDFYYGDPYFPPEEPIRGLLSKDYAKERIKGINWEKNDPAVKPGDPYPFEGRKNPFLHYLERWGKEDAIDTENLSPADIAPSKDSFEAERPPSRPSTKKAGSSP
jgi:gamma-glutamyltranspeptidase / glutathione hydrolase